MKKKLAALGGVAGLLLSPGLLVAQGTAAGGNKIAVINIQGTIATTAEGKKAFADLEKKYEPRRQELQRQQQEIQSLTDQLQRGTNTLSDEEKVRLNRTLEEKQKLFKRAQEDAASDYQAETQDVGSRIYKKMSPIIADYARKHGCVLVLDDTQIPVHYVAKEIDITEDIVKLYDATYPATAAADTPELRNPTGSAKRTTPPPRTSSSPPKPPAKPNP